MDCSRWGTVRIAPPERDLWMFTSAFATMLGEEAGGEVEDVLARYTRATGWPVTPDGLALYPVWWKLADITASLTYLTGYLEPGQVHPPASSPLVNG